MRAEKYVSQLSPYIILEVDWGGEAGGGHVALLFVWFQGWRLLMPTIQHCRGRLPSLGVTVGEWRRLALWPGLLSPFPILRIPGSSFPSAWDFSWIHSFGWEEDYTHRAYTEWAPHST